MTESGYKDDKNQLEGIIVKNIVAKAALYIYIYIYIYIIN